MCCPNGCGTAGSTCCGSTLFCDPGQTCCGDGCADEGHSCCGTSHQCEPDWKCCSKDTGACAPSGATCCGPEIYCDAGARCCQDPKDGEYYCSPGSSCLPTLIFDLAEFPGEDETWENLCRGIKRWAGYNPNTPNQIVLTWPGSRNSRVANANRIASGCENGNPCNKVFGSAGNTWSCEEFPPAASLEGGADASIICIPLSINRILGSRWGRANSNRNAGYQTLVKVKGLDCTTVSVDGISKKLARRSVVLKNDTATGAVYVNASVYGNDTAGSVALIIPFDVPYNFIGDFHIGYSISSGSLKSADLIDDWGNDFGK